MTRVLHVFGILDPGGAEMRTLDILRSLPAKEHIETHIVVLTGRAGVLDKDFTSAGAIIHYLPVRSLGFSVRFLGLLKRNRIHVLHSHVHHFTGYLLALAYVAGVPTRICHFRITEDDDAGSTRRMTMRRIGRALIARFATAILAVSRGAMDLAFRLDWQNDERCRVIYNGVRPVLITPTQLEQVRRDVRDELGVDYEARLICHIGRFDPQKNHARLVEIFGVIAAQDPRAYLVLVGRGGTRIEDGVKQVVLRLGVGDRVRILGLRDDVQRLLLASDVLLFPSLREGLPGAVLESLAVGTPCLASDIPGAREIARYCKGIELLALSESNETWAAKCSDVLSTGVSSRMERIRCFRQTPFLLETATAALLKEWH